MLTKSELLEFLKAHRVRLNKRLGQHHLVDPQLAARLVERCDLTSADTVVEIGAGLGALTELLAAKVERVCAVEVDRTICKLLQDRLDHLPNVEVLCQDILTFPWDRYPRSRVIGTIPYHITSPILISLCEQAARIARAHLALQQEVASRLAARPGTKAYGRLSVLIQFRFEVTQLVRIPKHAFFPQPKVDSMWIELTPRETPFVSLADERLFFDVVKAAFSQRRKILLNCLGTLSRPHLAREEIATIMSEQGKHLLPVTRAGELVGVVDRSDVLRAMVKGA